MTRRILMVDDNKTIQDLYRSRFTREHFHVTVVDNGMDAVKVLMAQPDYDLVILDLLVPVMDGYKVLQVIRSHPQLKSIPVLVFSAKSQPEEIEKAMAMGATDYLNKTVTKPDELVARVNELVSPRSGVTPDRSEPSIRYRLQIKDTALDAPQLAKDFKFNPFYTCAKCENEFIMELAVEADDPITFRGKLFCSRCQPPS